MPKFDDGKGVFKRYFVDNPDQIRLNGETGDWQTWLRKAKAADNIKYALKYVGGYGVPITIGGKSLYNLRQPINSDTK